MRSILPSKVSHILSPRLTVLVTSGIENKGNIMAVSWCTPVSFDPPMVAIAVSPERHSYGLIKEVGEFGINIPHKNMIDAVFRAGTQSGSKINKFDQLGLTPMRAKKIKVPLIEECVGFVECRVSDEFVTGDHMLFVGEVLSVYVKDEYYDEKGITPDVLIYWRDSQRKDDVWSF